MHQQGSNTMTPAGKVLFQMYGVFAGFKREMIRERVKTGVARARAKGKRLGRPCVGVEIEARIKALRAAGHGILKLARILGIGGGTVQRVRV